MMICMKCHNLFFWLDFREIDGSFLNRYPTAGAWCLLSYVGPTMVLLVGTFLPDVNVTGQKLCFRMFHCLYVL